MTSLCSEMKEWLWFSSVICFFDIEGHWALLSSLLQLSALRLLLTSSPSESPQSVIVAILLEIRMSLRVIKTACRMMFIFVGLPPLHPCRLEIQSLT
jgi:hypothetical protein